MQPIYQATEQILIVWLALDEGEKLTHVYNELSSIFGLSSKKLCAHPFRKIYSNGTESELRVRKNYNNT